MIKINNRLYSLIAILYVFLSLLGYSLATTLFLPLSSDATALSSLVTYPYRAVVFALAFLLIVTKPVVYEPLTARRMTLLYILFMLIYLFRILIDIFIREVYVEPGFRTTVLQYMFITMIPAIWATYRCARYINYEKLNIWLVYGGIALLGLTVMNQNTLLALEYEEMQRGEGNVAMGSLVLGYTCVTCFIIFLSWIISHRKGKWVWKTILLVFMVISFVVMLRAASRGPLVAFGVVVLFYLFSRIKNKALGIIITMLIILIVWLNISTLLNWLGSISPLMEERMSATITESDLSGRELLYDEAISIFLENPVFGKQFVLYNGSYSHNSILDVMIGLGFFGALVWVYLIWKDFKFSYQNVLKRSSLMAISLISVLDILKGFFSGAMYINHKLVICLMIVFIMKNDDDLEKNQTLFGF